MKKTFIILSIAISAALLTSAFITDPQKQKEKKTEKAKEQPKADSARVAKSKKAAYNVLPWWKDPKYFPQQYKESPCPFYIQKGGGC